MLGVKYRSCKRVGPTSEPNPRPNTRLDEYWVLTIGVVQGQDQQGSQLQDQIQSWAYIGC